MVAKGPKAIQLMLQDLGVAPKDDAVLRERRFGRRQARCPEGQGSDDDQAHRYAARLESARQPGPQRHAECRPKKASKDESSQRPLVVTNSTG